VRIRYTLPALADLESIFDYVAAHSPQGARRIQSRIKSAIALLPLHPHMGAPTEDPTIRRLVASPYPYVIFYEPVEAEIVIHAIRHAARDPKGMPGSSSSL